MLAIERRNAILAKLAAEGKVLVSNLSKEFEVTEETIRRDLEKLDNDGLSLVGYQAEKMVAGFHVDLAVCSCKGLDAVNGITDSNERDAEIKKAFFKSANRKLLAADSSKFDKSSFVKVCGFHEVDTIITEHKPNELWLDRLKQNSVEIVYENTEK